MLVGCTFLLCLLCHLFLLKSPPPSAIATATDLSWYSFPLVLIGRHLAGNVPYNPCPHSIPGRLPNSCFSFINDLRAGLDAAAAAGDMWPLRLLLLLLLPVPCIL